MRLTAGLDIFRYLDEICKGPGKIFKSVIHTTVFDPGSDSIAGAQGDVRSITVLLTSVPLHKCCLMIAEFSLVFVIIRCVFILNRRLCAYYRTMQILNNASRGAAQDSD